MLINFWRRGGLGVCMINRHEVRAKGSGGAALRTQAALLQIHKSGLCAAGEGQSFSLTGKKEGSRGAMTIPKP